MHERVDLAQVGNQIDLQASACMTCDQFNHENLETHDASQNGWRFM